jgi:hypothetical protein
VKPLFFLIENAHTEPKLECGKDVLKLSMTYGLTIAYITRFDEYMAEMSALLNIQTFPLIIN